MLLHRSFPDVERISARQSATRRDRLTARLPMLSPPHAEGGIGALRVEARGSDETGARVTHVVGIAELVGTATAAMAAAVVDCSSTRVHHGGVVTTSDDDLPTESLLRSVLRYGVRLQEFNGVPIVLVTEIGRAAVRRVGEAVRRSPSERLDRGGRARRAGRGAPRR